MRIYGILSLDLFKISFKYTIDFRYSWIYRYHSCTCSTVDVFELKTNKRTGQTCLSYRAFFLRSSYCVWTLWDFPLKKTPERSAPWDRNTTCSGCGGDGNKLSPTSSTSGPRHAIMSSGNQRCSN